jgi:hypothetical protein
MKKEKLLSRIHSKVKVLENGCHEWTGSCVKSLAGHGYGQCWFDNRRWFTHRFFWEQANGPVPDGLEIDHKCRNKLCVNVEHLRVATHKENMNNRDVCEKSHCKCGGELTIMPSGGKICKLCRDRRVKIWRENNRDRWNEIVRKCYKKRKESTKQ